MPQKKDWLALVAVHSDTWLFAVAFYNGARLNRDGRYVFLSLRRASMLTALEEFCTAYEGGLCRERLFELINEQPTCYEVVMGKGGAAPPKPKKPVVYSDPKPVPRSSRPVSLFLARLFSAAPDCAKDVGC